MHPWQVRWLEQGDAESFARARAFAAAKPLDRFALVAALEQPRLGGRARILEVTWAGRVHGLAAEIDVTAGSERTVFLDGSLPGAVSRALAVLERPVRVIALEPSWPELARAGAVPVEDRIQMARLSRTPLPERDPRVVRHETPCPDAADSRVHTGPSFAIADADGRIEACASVGVRTDAVAEIAALRTREDLRRRGLARAVLAETVRALEEKGRRVLAEIVSGDTISLRLFASLGFRGRARVRTARVP